MLGQLAGAVRPSVYFLSVAQLMAAVKDTLNHQCGLHSDKPCTLRKVMGVNRVVLGHRVQTPNKDFEARPPVVGLIFCSGP